MTPEESKRMAYLENKGGPITKEYVELFNKLAAHNLKILIEKNNVKKTQH